MWDLSSLTRDQTPVPCSGRLSLTHWTIGKSLPMLFKVPAIHYLLVCTKNKTFLYSFIIASMDLNS